MHGSRYAGRWIELLGGRAVSGFSRTEQRRSSRQQDVSYGESAYYNHHALFCTARQRRRRKNLDRAASTRPVRWTRSDSIHRFPERLDLGRQPAKHSTRSVSSADNGWRQDLASAAALRRNARGRYRTFLVRFAREWIAPDRCSTRQ